MRVRYEEVEGHLEPYYQCTEAAVRRAGKLCQSVRGRPIDEAISALLVESVAPAAIEVALAVQEEIAHRIEQAESFRRAQLERARYEAELARRRYLKVDPDNRLVADALEADWNDRLRQLDALQREHERPTRRRSGAAQRRGARTHSLARKRVPLHLERFAVRGAKGDGLRAGFSALPKGELLQCRPTPGAAIFDAVEPDWRASGGVVDEPRMAFAYGNCDGGRSDKKHRDHEDSGVRADRISAHRR